MIGEHLHEFFAICCTAACILNVQSLKTTAGGDSLSSKFEQLTAVVINGWQVGKFEVLKLVGLEDDLPKDHASSLFLSPNPSMVSF